MSTPVVTEIKIHLEPVTHDTFIDDLEGSNRSRPVSSQVARCAIRRGRPARRELRSRPSCTGW
jgi:hypothetical protein